MNNFLRGKKTYITGAVSIIAIGASVATGEMSWQNAITPLITALMGIFIRQGITHTSRF